MSLTPRAMARFAPEALASVWRILGRLFGHRRRWLVVHPILGMVIALSETVTLLATIRLLLLLVDGGTTTEVTVGSLDVALTFAQLAAVTLVALAATLVARLVEASASSRNQAAALRTARRLVIEGWFDADWEQLHGARLGRLQQLLGVNAQQAVVPVQLLSVASVAVISLSVYLTIVIASAPTVALMFGAVAAASAGVLNPLRRRSKRLAKRQTALVGELQLNATSYAHLNRELHVFGVQHAAAERLDAISADTAQSYARLKFVQRLLPSVYQQLLLAAIVGLVVVGRAVDVEAVQFGTAAILAIRSLSYIQQLNSSFQIYVESRPFLDELLDTVTANRERRRSRGDEILGPVRSISLRQVGYTYSSGSRGLVSVDLDVNAGDWLGVVGPSGGGKTTLANVIAGLLTPTEGQLLVNGRAPTDHTADSWTQQFALLSQEPVLLPGTVAENISFHRRADADEIREAARRAGIEGEIDRLPYGFDTPVGEGQGNLSGGQRQRLALARCLLGGPTCLILDEPTSALDAANEAMVEGSLRDIPTESIVIVVSHRPALLQRCNRFVALEQGQIVAVGSAADVGLTERVGTA